MTEPLTPAQRASIGWAGREGMSDSGNQFHYFRQSADDRILWGGYDAIYHPGNRVRPAYDRAPDDVREARPPVRRDVPPARRASRFTHAWGGAIDTTTRFTVTFGEALGGRVHYALGYTGLGVGSSRWAAGILRDRLLRPDSPLLELELVRSRPFPIPPEPIRTPGGGADAPRRDRRRRPRGAPLLVPPRDGRAWDRLRLVVPCRAPAFGWGARAIHVPRPGIASPPQPARARLRGARREPGAADQEPGVTQRGSSRVSVASGQRAVADELVVEALEVEAGAVAGLELAAQAADLAHPGHVGQGLARPSRCSGRSRSSRRSPTGRCRAASRSTAGATSPARASRSPRSAARRARPARRASRTAPRASGTARARRPGARRTGPSPRRTRRPRTGRRAAGTR